MMLKKNLWLPLVGATILSVSAMSSTPNSAFASDKNGLSAALRGDAANADGFRVVSARKMFRTQERPWSQIPTGAKLLVHAPEGVTEADIHRYASAVVTSDASPLGVEGASVTVRRSGDLYELHVTHAVRSKALEIQRRAAAL